MRKTWNAARKALVAVVGFAIVILGIILVPLPGPGLLVVLAGLLILSIEFEWARRHRDAIKRQVDSVTKRNK